MSLIRPIDIIELVVKIIISIVNEFTKKEAIAVIVEPIAKHIKKKVEVVNISKIAKIAATTHQIIQLMILSSSV
jgi:hypothetical protein